MRWPSLFLMGILISAARAAPQLGEGWTLEAAVARALAQHPARRAAKLEVEAAQAGRARASAAWLPQLQAVGQASARGPVPTLSIDTGLTLPGAPGPLTIERELGQTYAASLGAEAAWRALDFGTRGAMIEAAEAGWHAAQAGQAQIEVELAWATRQAYAAARFFEAAAEVSAKAARTAARDLADAEARLKAGLGDALAVAAARSRQAERRAAQVEAEAGLERAQGTLRLLLGLPADAPMRLIGAYQVAPPPLRADLSPQEAAAQARAAAKSAQARAADRAFWPTLDLIGNAAYATPRTFVEDEAGFTWQIAARLTWPLFDGDQRRRHRVQLEAEAAAARAQRQAVTTQRDQARVEGQAAAQAAAAALITAQDRVIAAEAWLNAARAGDRAGATTALDLERAADRLDAARLSVIRARFDAARARADQLKAEGVAQEAQP